MSMRWRWIVAAALLLSLSCSSSTARRAPDPPPPPSPASTATAVPPPAPPVLEPVQSFDWDIVYKQEAHSVQSPGKTAELFHSGARACPKCTVVNVFYATDRGLTGDYSRGSRIYGSTRGKVRYGVAQVSIPPWGAHRMGGLEKPKLVKLQMKWDPNKHVMLLDVSLDAESDWRKRIARAVSKSNREVFVFVHGFNVRFIDAARRTAQMSHDLQFEGVPVMYTWPSRAELSEEAYRADRDAADASVANLQRFLVSLAATPGVEGVHIVAHSMGNRLLAQALAAIASDPALRTKPRFNQIALTAPDIDSDVMARLARSITSVASRVTLYASSKDKALEFSVRVNAAPRAGLSHPNILIIPGIDSVDASAVDTNLVGHFYYAENRSVLNDIFNLIRGHPLPRAGVTRSRNYWVFAP